MTNTFKALSALLAYPTAEIAEAAEDIRAVIHGERLAPSWALNRLDPLIGELKRLDLYELQERYVFLFDRTRSLSLHLFEHVYGESRDRGQAMVDLRTLYERAGLEIAANELPDYLPLFLEFLSTRTVEEARALLAEPVAVIVALKERLLRRKSPYAAVFLMLEQIAENAPRSKDLEELRRAPDDDPSDLAALDKAWEEAAVTFGPSTEDGCPATRHILERMHRGGAQPQPAPRQEDAR
jgi:nitrate reductase delta subunit